MPLHVSLSAPLVLSTDQKNDFEEMLDKNIRESSLAPFEVKVRGLRWERNSDGTRWFLVLRITNLKFSNDTTSNELNRLLECSNECALSFGLPRLYEKGSEKPVDGDCLEPGKRRVMPDRTDAFHISIAWQLTPPSLKQRIVLAHPDVLKLGQAFLQFDVVKLKMGNVVKDMPL